MVGLVSVQSLLGLGQLKGIQVDMMERFIAIADTSLCVPDPFGTGFGLQLEVKCDGICRYLVAERTDGLVPFDNLGTLYGIRIQILVHLVVASSGHIHSFHIEMADVLSLITDFSAIFIHIYAGKFFQYILHILVLAGCKTGKIVFHRILTQGNTPAPDSDFLQGNGIGHQFYGHVFPLYDG